ncbi:unnamed protein product [Dovyalis caffra]|uniref:Glycosyltransferase N-terminal domain-containing protein n=1 Tax=Dovyalis caffra TaxID=77055 RepID=A0AAV1QVP8_9ROSI|nr:unnamed protein product [Dovyalis caffra]
MSPRVSAVYRNANVATPNIWSKPSSLQNVEHRSSMGKKPDPAPPHVLIFPFPAQGHINSMLKLAELLAFSGLKVTFLNSDYNHERLVRYTNIQARLSKYPAFHLHSISDGLPADHPRSGDRMMEMFESLKLMSKSFFKDLLTGIRPGVDCIIGDGNMGLFVDIATEFDVPVIHFRTISACCIWASLSLPQVIEAGELPIRAESSKPLTLQLQFTTSFLQAKMEIGSNPPPPLLHVLIFPLPAQGHVISMLKLAELLSLAGINITFLNSEYNHERLFRYTNIQDRFMKYPGFRFQTITDGLPVDHPRSGGQFMEIVDSIKLITKPIFKKMLLETMPPVNCIIVDGVFGSIGDVAIEVGIPIIYFRTISACSFWVYFSIIDIIEACQLPIRGNEDMDRLIAKVPGMETFLRCRDLPGFCRVSDMTDPNLLTIINETRKSPQAQALILNTFEDLEGPILSQIRTQCPKIYSVGPLHEHLEAKLSLKNEESCQSSNSLWEVDRSYKREEFARSAARMAELARKSVREGGSSYCNLNRLISDIRLMSVRGRDI